MTQQSFGSELRRLREQRGLSLKKFAKLVHYDPGYLSKIENGLKPPTITLAARWNWKPAVRCLHWCQRSLPASRSR